MRSFDCSSAVESRAPFRYFRRMRADVLDILDATYRVELPAKEWLTGVLETARFYLSRHQGAAGHFVDLEGDAPSRVLGLRGRNIPVPEEEVRAFFDAHVVGDPALSRSMHLPRCTTLREACARSGRPDVVAHFDALMAAHGLEDDDAIFLNGDDSGAGGCSLTFVVLEGARVDTRLRRRWERLATHLASAVRLRRRLEAKEGAPAPEAILSPSGAVQHAEGAARPEEARAALIDAVRAYDRAHASLGRRVDDGDAALREWTGLVAARWSLVEQFERDGKRYLVAFQNDPAVASLGLLSGRERQVVALLAQGHSNKSIAYELGLSVSTIAVLLRRAATKLGARSRREIASKYEEATRRAARAEADDS